MEIIVDNKKISAKKVNDYESAWRITDALDVFEYMFFSNQIILGGDILTKEMKRNYDNWFFNIDRSVSRHHNLVKSYITALDYIKRYMSKNGEDFYVVIVVDN